MSILTEHADSIAAGRDLSHAAANVTSQSGEDGIIAAALARLPSLNRWCVEFGAWDGKHLSNTFDLVDRRGYSVVLIEGDARKHKDLCASYPHRDRAIFLNVYVGWSDHDNLDQLLAPHGIPADPDLVSIDVDGNDYHIWRAMTRLRPKLVLIEYNPTIPNAVDFVQPAEPARNQGSSPAALVRLGKEKGYALIAATRLNLLFVDVRNYGRFEITDNSLESMRVDEPIYLFAGYDGSLLTNRPVSLPWHGMAISPERLQVLPALLRKYPAAYGLLRRWALLAFRVLSDPCGAPARVRGHMARRSAEKGGSR